MWTALATIVASIAVKILHAYWQRTDQTDAVRYRILKEMQPAIQAASDWKDSALRDPARAADLGLLADAQQGLRLDRENDPPPRGPGDRPVS